MTPGFDLKAYDGLLVEYHPHVIENEADLAQAQAALDHLLGLRKRSREEDALLDLMTTLVEAWERDHVEIPTLPAIELIRVLLEDRGLPQRALTPIFGTESIVSEVLSGKRGLRAEHIAGLATFFHCSPAAFFEPAAVSR